MKAKNELIAKFLGYSQPHPDYPNASYWYKKDKDPLCLLTFDSDWNWLIQVIEKIEKEYKFFVLISWQHCVIESNSCEFRIEKDSDTKLKATYNAVIEFIIYHNEFNK